MKILVLVLLGLLLSAGNALALGRMTPQERVDIRNQTRQGG